MEIVKILMNWAIPFICGAGISAAVAYRKKKSALAEGVKCLLRAEIIKAHGKYKEKGYCPLQMKDALTKEYQAYHNLGGNDVATSLYEELMKLPRNDRGDFF